MRGGYGGKSQDDEFGVAKADEGIEREEGVATDDDANDADAEGMDGGIAFGVAGGGAGGGLMSILCALMMSPKSGLSLIIFII